MSTLSLRLPESLHRKIRELAERDDVSINQFIAMAVAEKAAALLTVGYLEERGRASCPRGRVAYGETASEHRAAAGKPRADLSVKVEETGPRGSRLSRSMRSLPQPNLLRKCLVV